MGQEKKKGLDTRREDFEKENKDMGFRQMSKEEKDSLFEEAMEESMLGDCEMEKENKKNKRKHMKEFMTRKDNDEMKDGDDKEKRGGDDKKMDEGKKSKLNDRFQEFGEQPEMKEMLKMNKDKMYEDMEKMSDKFEIFIQMPDGEEKD